LREGWRGQSQDDLSQEDETLPLTSNRAFPLTSVPPAGILEILFFVMSGRIGCLFFGGFQDRSVRRLLPFGAGAVFYFAVCKA
jgi:hypothetical protein